jgi:transposase
MMKKSDSIQKTQQKYDKMNPTELLGVIQKQETEILGLKQELNQLISMVRLGNHQKYGRSGDSVPYPEGVEQLSFFNEAEKYGRKEDPEPSFESATAKVPKKPKEKGKKERDLSGLAVTVIDHELPETDQSCPECGNELHEMKIEVTKILKLVPAHFEVEEHRRHVYTCRECEKTQGEGDTLPFVRAYMPNLPLPGSFASAELLAGIINSKYVNHMPLARIESEFNRMDSVLISRQTMSNWMLKISEQYMAPLNLRMKEVMLSKPILHCDETHCIVVYEDGTESRKKCYMCYVLSLHERLKYKNRQYNQAFHTKTHNITFYLTFLMKSGRS